MTRPDAPSIGPDFFEEMVESVGVGVAIYGADGRYEYVNEAYADTLGTDRETLTATPLWEVVRDFERERFEDYWTSFEDGETRVEEAVHEFEGTSVPVSTITTRRRIDGVPYHFGTVQDITERKRREEELKRQNERLEAFAGIVSHDLRNPLNVAQGYLELLQERHDSDELDLIDSALNRMGILIDDLLTLAREGQSIDSVEPVSLPDVAATAWSNVDTANATLSVTDGATVRADDRRLQQLFENLFRNSVEHGSTGSRPEADDGVAHGSTGNRAKPGDSVEHAGDDVSVRVGTLDAESGIFVADDGPGIDPDERDRVFEPSYTTTDDGTGFGLAIVKEISDAHGWDLRVTESETGGARFEFVVNE